MATRPDLSFWLGRKYALLQQQADATTQNAASSAIASRAAADVDTARASLMPAESAAQIAAQRAQTNLTNLQSQTVLPESEARVGQMRAETGLTTERAIGERQLNKQTPTSQSSLQAVRRLLGRTAPSLSQDLDTRPTLDTTPTVNPPPQDRWWRF